MRNEPDPLEADLSALRPHAVSPELRQRIAERLVEKGDWPRAADLGFQKRIPTARGLSLRGLSLVFNRRMALAGSLAATCLVAVLLRWGGDRAVESKTIAVQPQPAPRARIEDADVPDPLPTLLAYQRALDRSPEELEALLDKHALVTPAPDPELVRIGTYIRSDAAIHALIGDF